MANNQSLSTKVISSFSRSCDEIRPSVNWQSVIEVDKRNLTSEQSLLSFLHYNVEGLGNKFDSFELFVLEMDPHILIVTEHQKSNENIGLYQLEGYKLVSFYCRSRHKGGGVAIYCKYDINITLGNNIEWVNDFSVEMDCEIAVVKFTYCTVTFFVVGIYRSPSGNIDVFFNLLDCFLTKLSSRYSRPNIVLMGDMNINTMVDSQVSRRFRDCIQSHGTIDLLSHVPTRVTLNGSSSIDHVITNFNNIEDSKVVNGHISDHFGQILTIRTNTPNNRKIENKIEYRRIFSQNNIKLLKSDLKKESWNSVYTAQDTNSKWNNFLGILTWHLDASCPLKKVELNRNKKLRVDRVQLDEKAFKLKENMHDMYDLYRSTGLELYKQRYKSFKNQYRKEVKRLKFDFFAKKIKNSDCVSKTCWKIVSDTRNVKEEAHNIKININNYTEVKPQVISELFNNYFIEVVENDTTCLNVRHNSNELSPMVTNHSLSDLPPVSVKDIYTLINKLKPKKSTGFDEISPYLLKQCKDGIVEPLLHLINNVITEGIFPDILKLAVVKPLYKKGEKSSIKNYRPIALTSIFSKIIEKYILLNITEYNENFRVLNNFQHGFRKGCSTISAVSEFYHTALEKINEGYQVAGVLLDLTKAFDRVHHGILLSKLSKHGLIGNILKLIESYLNNRRQCTEIIFDDGKEVKKYRSNIRNIYFGVPQGSVLGPYLFIMYMNDFSLSLSDNYFLTMYADDTSCISWSMDLNNLINNVQCLLQETKHELEQSNLIMNLEKTELIHFNSSGVNELHVNTNEFSVKSKSAGKFLGLFLDRDLNWGQHIDYVCKKLSSNLFLLRRMSSYLSSDELKIIYFGTIYPYLSYGIVVWGGTFTTYLNRIFILQKHSLRTIAKVTPRTSCRPLFVKYNLLTVYALYIYQTVLLVRKDSKFTKKNAEIHSYNTRHRLDYHRTQSRLKLTQNSPFIRGAIFYNQLPTEIKNLENNSFETTLKKRLIELCPYSFEDFANF